MIPFFPTTLLAQVQAADTVVTIAARDGLQTLALISSVVVGVFFVVLVPVVVVLFLQLRKLDRTVRSVAGKGLERTQPLLEGGREIADNVAFISHALRVDVERLSGSVKALAGRLQQASDRMEERIEEFNALMEVVQGEAEGLFLDTASTVRGVKASARSLGATSATPARAEPEQPTGGSTEGSEGNAPDAAEAIEPSSSPSAEGPDDGDEGTPPLETAARAEA